MKISVIIPYGGKLKELTLVLYNLHNRQIRKPDEIIVVGDGADLTSVEPLHAIYNFVLLDAGTPLDGRFRAGHARNIGATSATGEILVFQDQDMLLGERWLKVIDKYFKDGHNGIPNGNFHDLDKEFMKVPTKDLFWYVKKKDDFKMDRADKCKGNVEEIVDWLPWCTESRAFAILKRVFWECSGFDEQFVGWGLEDTEFFYRAKKDKNYRCHKMFELFSQHIEHEVDPVYMMDSMKENAEIFIAKHPEAKELLKVVWREWNIFDENKTLGHTYDTIKKIRKKSGVEDFGKLPSMRYFRQWRY